MIEAKRGLRQFNASERSRYLGPCGQQQSIRITVIAYRLRVHARTITMLLSSQTVITKNTEFLTNLYVLSFNWITYIDSKERQCFWVLNLKGIGDRKVKFYSRCRYLLFNCAYSRVMHTAAAYAAIGAIINIDLPLNGMNKGSKGGFRWQSEYPWCIIVCLKFNFLHSLAYNILKEIECWLIKKRIIEMTYSMSEVHSIPSVQQIELWIVLNKSKYNDDFIRSIDLLTTSLDLNQFSYIMLYPVLDLAKLNYTFITCNNKLKNKLWSFRGDRSMWSSVKLLDKTTSKRALNDKS
ncbi:hypothetical protein AGLY_009106 [Aphis glycines]|uniref:Uncharacterized protein n=1 Tax=Aphis glycines TaxID=307491 RepID=A0A6G0TJ86_APHGL|nr:hypothetical protein AGLY_009106 [Aphis glycines]